MPKIELTARRTVEATGTWFTVNADPTRVTVRTAFGFVCIDRTNKGLYVHIKPADVDEAFISTSTTGDNFTPLLGKHDFMVALRPVGLIQLQEWSGENEKTPLADYVRAWFARHRKKESNDENRKENKK